MSPYVDYITLISRDNLSDCSAREYSVQDQLTNIPKSQTTIAAVVQSEKAILTVRSKGKSSIGYPRPMRKLDVSCDT